MNALTPLNPPPPDDDGFSSTSHQAIAAYLKWTDALGWHDRDGCKPPSPLLVWKLTEFAGHWEDTPEGKRRLLKRPLQELEQLNAAIPENQWKLGPNGKPEKPWKHYVGIYFIDPATGKGFKYEHNTWGAIKMHAELAEAVTNMRIIRRTNCLPLVDPTEKPWKLDTGLRKRPSLNILGFKTPPGEAPGTIPAKLPTPQLTGPTTVPVETSAPTNKEKPADNWRPPAQVQQAPSQPQQAPTQPQQAPAQPQQTKSKVQVNLDAMSDVAPLTTAEIMDDDVPW